VKAGENNIRFAAHNVWEGLFSVVVTHVLIGTVDRAVLYSSWLEVCVVPLVITSVIVN
jgi:hypothetical protein